MLAVVPVRDGVLPAGGAETVAECGGHALIVGSAPTADELAGVGRDVALLELGPFAPGRWADALVELVGPEPLIVLPASPDGRDLAPRLAHALDRPLLTGAIRITRHDAQLARGTLLHDVAIAGPVVVTMQPGVRGVVPDPSSECLVRVLPAPNTPMGGGSGLDAEVADVLPPDVTTMDLAEADRIFGGGAGLDAEERFAQLAAVAGALGASMGATRVITDRGWADHQRQIGTTGVVVDPVLYVALGISGAVQHTAGLGTPEHIVSVNSDPHCPMMQLADLAVVADANAVLDELERLVLTRVADG
ncbi:MAG: mycofactocin-associated electron transfer flavoprotein alpha subunit [Ilumatobacteraceae bacterium]